MQAERSTSPSYSGGLATAYVSGGELAFSRRMSHWILRTLCNGHVGRMIDIACGAGEAVRVFREAGWQAEGLDRSEAMLRLARTRNRGDTIFRQGVMQDMSDIKTGFDLVTCMYDAINCNLSVEDLSATFRNVNRLLAPGGRFVFDGFTIGGLYHCYDGLELHTRNRDHIVLTAARVDRRRNIGTKELIGASRLMDWAPWREVHHVRAYSPKLLLARLTQARFTPLAIYGWPSGQAMAADETDPLDRIVVAAQR